MDKDQLQKLGNDLEQEEKNLIDQLNRIANKNPLVKGDFEVRVPNYGDEDEDNAREATDLDKNFALTQELETKLNSIKKTREKKITIFTFRHSLFGDKPPYHARSMSLAWAKELLTRPFVHSKSFVKLVFLIF